MKLNLEQQKIIEQEPGGHSLVKGVAGSGKTTVAIHRLAFLREQYSPEEDDSILLVTFNKTLLNFIKHQFHQLDTESSNSNTNLFQNKGELDITNVDKLMFSYYYSYRKRHRLNSEIVKPYKQRTLLNQAILQISDQYPGVKWLTTEYSSFLLDEISWIESCSIPDLEAYQTIERTGRQSGGQGNNPQRLNRNSTTREAIYKLMERFHLLLEKENLITFKTMNRMALEEAKYATKKQYTHILIDEAQDLSKVQLEFLKLLHQEKEYSSLMFIADNTQSIYSQSWLGKGRPYSSLGYDMSGKSRILSKNYRTTTEISKAAYALIERDESIQKNIDFVKPALIDRHGHAPVYRLFQSYQQQADFLTKEIAALQNEYPLGDICIVAKEHRLLDSAGTALEEAGIPYESLTEKNPKFEEDTVKLTTMHSIKGLEFGVIFLINLDDGIIPNTKLHMDDSEAIESEERKLLYVGMTRAKNLLYMTSVGTPSQFIDELDSQSLKLMRGSELHPFRHIPIQDYQLTDSIADLQSKEEVVRQWLLKELQETYGYPLELLHLEYPVQQFSQRGYVDVAVTIQADGKETPYIFAEVKPSDYPLEDAYAQLKSYMQADKDVQYGLLTNGFEVILIDRDGTLVQDLPAFQPHFIQSSSHERVYKDLRHNRSYRYLQDSEDETSINVIDAVSEESLDSSSGIQVPILGNVAAGIPTTAVQEYEDSLLLPENWIIEPENTFALRITGDSMIDAGIDKDDLVIVHQQTTAHNGDIVVVLIDGEATVKTFRLMGGFLLLIPENTKYEPITMDPEDVQINGKVIGVMKN